MVAQNSIEERVIALMQEKQELFDSVVGGANDENILTRLGRAELLQLLEG
jgi:SNF2 family DNA or RNA helicase